MKNPIKILIIILILAISGGLYFHSINKTEIMSNENKATTSVKVLSSSLTDAEFIKSSADPEGKVLVRGDMNGDKYEDAIVAETFCGASCTINLAIVLNQDNKMTKLIDNTHFDGYLSGTALKSDVSSISIENGIITLTGRGLDCGENCTEDKWNVIKKLQYELIENDIVRLPLR